MTKTFYEVVADDSILSHDGFEYEVVAKFEQVEWCAEHDESWRPGNFEGSCLVGQEWSGPDECRRVTIWIQQDRQERIGQ